MKINLQKVFILTKEENEVMNKYLTWLSTNNLPCTNCDAKIFGKCKGYDIWKNSYSNEEVCIAIRGWIDNGKILRDTFDLLLDEDFKKLIENRYNFDIATKEKEKAETIYLIAKNKYEEEKIARIQTDYKLKNDDGEFWGNKQEEFWNDNDVKGGKKCTEQ